MAAIFTPEIIVFLLIAGSLVGFVSAFFGVGGCFIMVPVMIFCFNELMGVPLEIAVKVSFGTNMAVVVPTAFSGAWKHSQKISFPKKHYLYYAIPVGIGSVIGSVGAYFAPGYILKILFGIVCIIGAYRFMTARPKHVAELKEVNKEKYVAGGLGSGGLAHFMGIGGGLVYMPVLNTLLEIPIHMAVLISISTMVIGSSVGAVSFGILGSLNQTAAYPPYSFGWFNLIAFLTLASTSVITAQLGASMTHRIQPRKLKILLAILYIYVGLRLIGVFAWLGIPI